MGGRRNPADESSRRESDAPAIFWQRALETQQEKSMSAIRFKRNRAGSGKGRASFSGIEDTDLRRGQRADHGPGSIPKQCWSITISATPARMVLTSFGKSTGSEKSAFARCTSKIIPIILAKERLIWRRYSALFPELVIDGFANLETDSPSKSIETDMKRNLTYVRKMMTGIR